MGICEFRIILPQIARCLPEPCCSKARPQGQERGATHHQLGRVHNSQPLCHCCHLACSCMQLSARTHASCTTGCMLARACGLRQCPCASRTQVRMVSLKSQVRYAWRVSISTDGPHGCKDKPAESGEQGVLLLRVAAMLGTAPHELHAPAAQ